MSGSILARAKCPRIKLETSYQEPAEVTKMKWAAATCKQTACPAPSKPSINGTCCRHSLRLSDSTPRTAPPRAGGWRSEWWLCEGSMHYRGHVCGSRGSHKVVRGNLGSPRVPEGSCWYNPEGVKWKSNGWRSKTQQGVPSVPQTACTFLVLLW